MHICFNILLIILYIHLSIYIYNKHLSYFQSLNKGWEGMETIEDGKVCEPKVRMPPPRPVYTTTTTVSFVHLNIIILSLKFSAINSLLYAS